MVDKQAYQLNFVDSDEEEEVNDEEKTPQPLFTGTGDRLVHYIQSFGTVTGHGPYKGTITIVVKSPSSDKKIDFNIGRYQGLRLIKKCTRSTTTDDYNNLVDRFDHNVEGVFHLMVKHSDAIYVVTQDSNHGSNWYEVNLLELPCVSCRKPGVPKYLGDKICRPFD
jgi:hypothetical protein